MNLRDAVSRIIAALDEAGLEYMLVGSFSSMYYSFPRSTTDADFVIGTSDWDPQTWAKRLGLTELLANAWTTATETKD